MAHPALARELIRMMRRDQRMRIAFGKGKRRWDRFLDRAHTKRMKVIVRTYGWPTFAMVGKRGAVAAWFLVQHADHDVGWQERCRARMERAVAERQAPPEFYAMLVDRVLVNHGKRQRYGSQWYTNTRGVFAPRLIQNRKQLALRRRRMGMRPFREYEKQMRAMFRRWQPKQP